MDFNAMVNYALECITQKYADFSGRARRMEFWSFTLFTGAISLVLNILYKTTDSTIFSILAGFFSLAVLVPGLAVSWRRLHDTGRKGAWYLLNLIPVIGWIVLFVWYCQDGTPGDNEFGPDPKR